MIPQAQLGWNAPPRVCQCPSGCGPMMPVRGADHVTVVGYVCRCGQEVHARSIQLSDPTADPCAEPADAYRGLESESGAWIGPEKVLVQNIRDALSARGYRVMRCGQLNAKGAGSDAGLPDLWVYLPSRDAWKGIEVKTARGRLSEEQQELAESGCICVVRSVSDALRAIGEV